MSEEWQHDVGNLTGPTASGSHRLDVRLQLWADGWKWGHVDAVLRQEEGQAAVEVEFDDAADNVLVIWSHETFGIMFRVSDATFVNSLVSKGWDQCYEAGDNNIVTIDMAAIIIPANCNISVLE